MLLISIIIALFATLALCAFVDTVMFGNYTEAVRPLNANEMFRRRNWQEYMRRRQEETERYVADGYDQHIGNGFLIDDDDVDYENYVIALGRLAQLHRR
uniref:Uncharacterized protein n=1 Tax=Panagrolaimus superbus TaxID=310955 RepID=A0A914Z088_9BILA